MSGRMPDSSQIWTFQNSFRNEQNWTFIHEPKRSEWTALPQHFKNAGWWAAGAGKLYHRAFQLAICNRTVFVGENIESMRRLCCIAAGSPKNEDNPLSWSVTYPEDVGGGCSCTPMQNFCRLPENTTCYDVVLTDTVIADLHEHQTNSSISSMPFFLGLGVHKPHLPWAVPGSFFDLCKFHPPVYSW
jgi:iduronate 2-sulfatase